MITAANASAIADGACSLILMRYEQARTLNMPILARICGYTIMLSSRDLYCTDFCHSSAFTACEMVAE